MSDLIEPVVILDTFVQGVGRVEEVSAGLFRVSYYAHQRGFDGSQGTRLRGQVHRHGRHDGRDGTVDRSTGSSGPAVGQVAFADELKSCKFAGLARCLTVAGFLPLDRNESAGGRVIHHRTIEPMEVTVRKLIFASVLAFATIAAVTSPTQAQFLFGGYHGGYYGGFGGIIPFPYRPYYSPYYYDDPYYAVPYRPYYRYHPRYYHRYYYPHRYYYYRHHYRHHHRHHHHRHYY